MLYEVITDISVLAALVKNLEHLHIKTVFSHLSSADEEAQDDVITSYSIHYTKLYDFLILLSCLCQYNVLHICPQLFFLLIY